MSGSVLNKLCDISQGSVWEAVCLTPWHDKMLAIIDRRADQHRNYMDIILVKL